MKALKITLILVTLLALMPWRANAQVTTSPDTVCVGAQGVIYFVTNTPGSTYNWSVTGFGHTINGNGANQITVDWANTVGVDTLTVVETNMYGCVGDPVVLPVVRIPLPEVDAGVDALICEGNTYTISTATAQYYSSLDWTTSGTGTFLNNGTLTPTYIPGAADIAAGTVTLEVIAYGNAPCGNDTDQMVITITPLPLADAGPDALICEGQSFTITGATASNYSMVQWTSSGSGAIINGTTLSPMYTPSAADIASGTVTLTMIAYGQNPCGNDTDQMVINITPMVLADAGPDAIICEGDAYTIPSATASNYTALNWATSGTGSFVNNGTLTPTYTPSVADIAAGQVTLTLNATGINPCADASDFLILDITPAPVVAAGPDSIICEGNTFTVPSATATNFAVINWTTSGTGTFINNGTVSPTYVPSAADIASGNVNLVITLAGNNPCNPVSDTISLDITPLPVVSAGQDDIICEGNTYTISTASASNQSSILWTTTGTGTFVNNGTLTPIYTPSAADIAAGGVDLIITAFGMNPCGDDIDTMHLAITPLPIADAGVNDTICEGDVYTVSTSNVANFFNMGWTTTGTGTFNNPNILNPIYTPSAADIAAGSVDLIFTAYGMNPCGDDVDTMTLTITPLPHVNAGHNDTICEGSTYTVSTSNAVNYNSLNWTTTGTGTFVNNGTLNPIYTPSAADIAAGSVDLIITAFGNSPCGDDVDTMTLTIIPAPLVDAGPNDTICEGDNFTVTAATAANYTQLTWTTSGTGTFTNPNTLTPTYVPSAADITNGNVTLTLTADGILPCGSVSDDMILIINPKPVTSPIFHF